MNKETFDRAYTLFREVKYFKRKLNVMPDIIPRYFYLILCERYRSHERILEAFFALNPGSKLMLSRIWYQALQIYPVKTHRQNELSERLRQWRVDHKVQSDNHKPLWQAFDRCERCNGRLNQEKFERFCGVCDNCNMKAAKKKLRQKRN